ncbi:MAG TPA: hypothetical protein VGO11_16210 [Chthoniobacteraceae bacterium]|jgi:hypothetical protein|nr:hypothetical protein [Chthoniobacteraceae bacterium]
MKRKRIVVMGFMASIPIAGVVWQHLHYIVGLQRLGHEVFYIEDSQRFPYNPVTWETLPDYTFAAETLRSLAQQYGFEDRWAFCARYLDPVECVGLPHARVLELYREADAILNVCGSQELYPALLESSRLIYVESDPGLEQMAIDNGDPKSIAKLQAHHALFSFGENVGTDRYLVPAHGYAWKPTRQPVVTDLWKSPTPPPAGARFTSIANWNTSGLKDIEWRGDKYLWSKSLEFLKFLEAPKLAGEEFELATIIRDEPTLQRFAECHWRLVPPDPISNDHLKYRDYIQDSKGEFTAAKDQYVRLNTAWFSDRSACYLAAGRPVITQETGFTRFYGGKKGLFAFRTLEEIGEAVREINADYAVHAQAAYEIAAEYFEATKVLARLLDDAGV